LVCLFLSFFFFNVELDPVGLIVESTKVIKWNGRILVIGFAGGKIPSFPVNRALLKNCSIVGYFFNFRFLFFLVLIMFVNIS